MKGEQGLNGRAAGRKTSITELKQLHTELTELRQTLTAEEVAHRRAEEDMQQLAYAVSHDLQEPLRMVASYMTLLQRRYEGQLDPDADEFIGFAADGASRMQSMVTDLLLFSRVNSRGGPFEEVDCTSALGKVRCALSGPIEESCAVVTHFELPRVEADGEQLVRVFHNLIDNAIKFRGDTPPRVHIGAVEEGGVWHFTVRDNGMGIREKDLSRIFIMFQRLHGRDEYPGTGSGLAIAKRIVERHGGRMWTGSEPGKGSTFHFTMPKKR